jgi:hypothetical protein
MTSQPTSASDVLFGIDALFFTDPTEEVLIN